MEQRISVRNFVEFLLRNGDIDNRRKGSSEQAMAEGNRIHRKIQGRMGMEYEAEVSLSHSITCENYTFTIEGRADGIITKEDKVVIDEIKACYKDVSKMQEPVLEHLGQAKCYAYIYATKHDLNVIGVRMTYCNIDTEEMRYFTYSFEYKELQSWFMKLFYEYQKWLDFEFEWKQKRNQSLQTVDFPFSYREGQKELVTHVYNTIANKKKLYIQAPTGVGKTISTIFPATKAMAVDKADKIFYLTAKTITRTVARNAIELMRQRGARFKSVILTAKDKICFLEETSCNPGDCPYAKGHFDRVNDAIYDIICHEDDLTKDVIVRYSQMHMVCPFELSLDLSLFCDGIICDYNYLFDPYVYLRRFFYQGNKENYIFLVDEAHNLVERAREMYSATIVKEDFLHMKKVIEPFSSNLKKRFELCNKELLSWKRQCETACVVEEYDSVVRAVLRLHSGIGKFLEERDNTPIHQELLEFYFAISRFLDVYEELDENYITYSAYNEKGEFYLKQFCVNPSKRLKETMKNGLSTILFSATFLPIQYYKMLLGGDENDYEVYAKSLFKEENRLLLIGNQVTTKYTRRCEDEFKRIADYIHEISQGKKGNYMVFFPSYQFMNQVLNLFLEFYSLGIQCLVQEEGMDEKDREDFLSMFIDGGEDTLIGFCVMGGIFSEGIDLVDDQLIGVIIVGTGLPQVSYERELLKDYFDCEGKNGFDFAYRYPGMNKVTQAAGRAIRTDTDRGVIALLDERFLQNEYKKMFPREWEHFDIVRLGESREKLNHFWKD